MAPNSPTAEADRVKTEEQSTKIGSFQFALDEAKRRAREANPRKELSLETKPPVSAKEERVNKPSANTYAGLTSAKKRKHDNIVTEKAMSPAQRSDGSSHTSPHLTPTEEGSKRPFAPPKKAKRAPVKYDEIEPVNTRRTRETSDFYNNINMKEKHSRSDVETVKYINTLIKRRQDLPPKADPERLYSDIRQRLHQMEFYDFISGVILKKSKVLDETQGLPAIFDHQTVDYPWDIRADAESLYLRWLSGITDPHLLRGIETLRKTTNGTKRTTHRLEPSYKDRRSCDHVGPGDLQNGQWWPLQIAAMRDGAHGEIEAGIHGKPERGAFSVVLSSGGYADQDEGTTIRYCGTSGSAGKPSLGTNYLKRSCGLGNPVRVLRSAALPARNPYRPSRGLRYDGMYDVVSFEILDEGTAMHRFLLERREGQDPIRFQGVEVRPTNEEVAEYTKIRGLLGLSS